MTPFQAMWTNFLQFGSFTDVFRLKSYKYGENLSISRRNDALLPLTTISKNDLRHDKIKQIFGRESGFQMLDTTNLKISKNANYPIRFKAALIGFCIIYSITPSMSPNHYVSLTYYDGIR